MGKALANNYKIKRLETQKKMDYVMIVLEVGRNAVPWHEGSKWNGMRLDRAKGMMEEGQG